MSNRKYKTTSLTNEERALWIFNDEGLHEWFSRSGMKIESFVEEFSLEIDKHIIPMLNGEKFRSHLKVEKKPKREKP